MPRAPTTLDPFNAIAEPRRREILELLDGDPQPVSAIVDALKLAQPSVSKHLQVLLKVGLVEVRREGRQAFYHTNGESLRAIHMWTERFERHWLKKLLRIKERAELAAQSATQSAASSKDPPSRTQDRNA